MPETPLLTITDLHVAYGGIRALQGVSLTVNAGEIVTLIGANGAGKSTLLRAISGLVPALSGKISFSGTNLRGLPTHRIVAMGIAHVPEGRSIFANLTVLENLRLAAWTRKDAGGVQRDLARVFDLFPRIGYSAFHLSLKRGILLPGGQTVFSACAAGRSAEQVLTDAGLHSRERIPLDPEQGVEMNIWRRV